VQPAETAERIWRARRRHHHIDAVVRPHATACDLQFFHDDRLMVSWPFADRERAVAEAAARLKELQRAGWNVHW
jgi:hypothetical protein